MTEFERLYLQNKAEFRRYIHFLTIKGGYDAVNWKDLMQEASIKMFLNFDKYTPKTNFYAWGRKVIFNVYITMYRREVMLNIENTTFSAVDVYSQDGMMFAGLHYDNPDNAEMDAFMGNFSNVLSDEVAHALDSIPPQLREIIILKDICGYEEKEISVLLNIHVHSVKTRVRRARLAMSVYLLDYTDIGNLTNRFSKEYAKLHSHYSGNMSNKKEVVKFLLWAANS